MNGQLPDVLAARSRTESQNFQDSAVQRVADG